MKKISYKVNEWGESVTFCPNGRISFTSRRKMRVKDDCRKCRYHVSIDYENKIVECSYGTAKKKKD